MREQLLKARSDQPRGIPVAFERQTLEQFLNKWLDNTLKARAKPRSVESFTTIARKHTIREIGKIRIDKLPPEHIRELLERKRRSRKIKDREGASPPRTANDR